METSSKIRNLYEVSDGRHRLTAMEGLRGFAVLLVFFVHAHALFGNYAASQPILGWNSHFLGDIGNTGVDLFFVLSGYLIYGALIRKKVSYLNFLRRRVERIYPTFLAVFCVYLILSVAFESESKIHGSFLSAGIYILENAFLLPGIFPIKPIITVAWSLSYEFFFYLLIPIVVWLAGMRGWKSATRAVFFVMLWLAYIIYAFTVPRSQVRLLMFVAGILLYEALDSGWLESKLTRLGEIFAIMLFLLSLAFVYVYDARPEWLSALPALTAGRTILPGVPAFQGPYKVIALSFSCPILTVFSFQYDGILKRIFSWNPLRYLGNMSYSYYLIHGLALHGVAVIISRILPLGRHDVLAYFLGLLIGFVATWIASTFLFAFVEKPMSLRRHLTAVPRTQSEAPAPVVPFSSEQALDAANSESSGPRGPGLDVDQEKRKCD